MLNKLLICVAYEYFQKGFLLINLVKCRCSFLSIYDEYIRVVVFIINEQIKNFLFYTTIFNFLSNIFNAVLAKQV